MKHFKNNYNIKPNWFVRNSVFCFTVIYLVIVFTSYQIFFRHNKNQSTGIGWVENYFFGNEEYDNLINIDYDSVKAVQLGKIFKGEKLILKRNLGMQSVVIKPDNESVLEKKRFPFYNFSTFSDKLMIQLGKKLIYTEKGLTELDSSKSVDWDYVTKEDEYFGFYTEEQPTPIINMEGTLRYKYDIVEDKIKEIKISTDPTKAPQSIKLKDSTIVGSFYFLEDRKITNDTIGSIDTVFRGNNSWTGNHFIESLGREGLLISTFKENNHLLLFETRMSRNSKYNSLAELNFKGNLMDYSATINNPLFIIKEENNIFLYQIPSIALKKNKIKLPNFDAVHFIPGPDHEFINVEDEILILGLKADTLNLLSINLNKRSYSILNTLYINNLKADYKIGCTIIDDESFWVNIFQQSGQCQFIYFEKEKKTGKYISLVYDNFDISQEALYQNSLFLKNQIVYFNSNNDPVKLLKGKKVDLTPQDSAFFKNFGTKNIKCLRFYNAGWQYIISLSVKDFNYFLLAAKDNQGNYKYKLVGKHSKLPKDIFSAIPENDNYITCLLLALLLVFYFFGRIFFVEWVNSLSHKDKEEYLNRIPSLKRKILKIEQIANNLKMWSNTMLALGITFGVGGLAAFYIVVGINFDTNSITDWSSPNTALNFLRPTFLLIFIETFTFFFLRQYRVIFNEYKLFYSVYLRLYNYFHLIEIEPGEKISDNMIKILIEKLQNEKFDLYESNKTSQINEFDNEVLKKIIDKIPSGK